MQNAATIEKSLQHINEYAESPLGDMRVIDVFPVNKHVRQGDLYVKRVESFNKEDYQLTSNRQLAPGETKGSRHTVSDSVEVWVPKQPQNVVRGAVGFSMQGPVIVSKDRFTVSHVEHADFSVPGGIYNVSYQCDPVQLARVQD